jgi:hypothetical protein
MKYIVLTALLCAGHAAAATLIYQATLTGAAERPTPVSTSGSGTATLTVDDVTGAWTLTGSFTNLTGNASNAHIHGPANTTGSAGFIKQLQYTSDVTAGSISGSSVATSAFTSTQLIDLSNQLHYVNIHSSFATNGELRGQLVPVPEPSVAALGLLGLGLVRRRRRC